MSENRLRAAVRRAYEENRRLVVPLVGFPGLVLTHGTIKLAQQNYGEHFKVVKAIAEKYSPDAVFPLMDLSVEANALGRYTVFPREESATVVKEKFDADDLAGIAGVGMGFDTRLLGYVETLKLMSIGLPSSMYKGAYVTGPYTLAGLLMGADEAALATVMKPEELHAVCRLTALKVLDYVRLLIAAGAQIICVLEPSAVMLGPEQFEEFSAQYTMKIVEACRHAGVVSIYHVCGNSMHLIESMTTSGVDALSVDSPEAGIDIEAVARRVPPEIVVIGNINPVGPLLRGTPADVGRDVERLLKAMDPYPNFVLSTGCDLPQETPLENLAEFMRVGRCHRIEGRGIGRN